MSLNEFNVETHGYQMRLSEIAVMTLPLTFRRFIFVTFDCSCEISSLTKHYIKFSLDKCAWVCGNFSNMLNLTTLLMFFTDSGNNRKLHQSIKRRNARDG